ncbi:MAG: hypothetical protein A2135_00265 [Actinobacteria bacterium RBG_16_67_15]|nr:MAG: hypothetical protein A2135_00265 [Actinobacteria bacterium RBG_16_67_15]
MTTSHLCNGKWKPGPVSDCPKHTRLSKKQSSVYRRGDGDGGGATRSGGESKPSGGSKPD